KRSLSAFSLLSEIIKSLKLWTLFSNIFWGFKKLIAFGISPLNTAVACFPKLFKAMVRPRAADSSSTLGLDFTVTSMLLTCFIRLIMSCWAGCIFIIDTSIKWR
ncbi:MAG: hypothetical protein QG623_277, partial [Patescibacteria group bacterium]|nr:hypothetical protein [Patescibacteria group bacterium]